MNSIQDLLLFDRDVPIEYADALNEIAGYFPIALGGSATRIVIHYGDRWFEERNYPPEWEAFYAPANAQHAAEIGFRPLADPRQSSAHELWHFMQDQADRQTLFLTEAAAERMGLQSAHENEAHAAQVIYSSAAHWKRWSTLVAKDGTDDWATFKTWAAANGVTLPPWSLVPEPAPAPAPPMLPPEEKPGGMMMRLWVPFKALAATARALNGAPMEATAIPLLDEFYHPANRYQQEIARHFPVREWGHVARIMRRESGFNPAAACHDCFEVFWPEATGRPDWETVTQHGDVGDRPAVRGRGEWRVIPENSQGLLQINVVAWPQFAAWDLHDPDRACAAGRIIFDDGRRQGDPYKHWRSADPRVFTPTAVI